MLLHRGLYAVQLPDEQGGHPYVSGRASQCGSGGSGSSGAGGRSGAATGEAGVWRTTREEGDAHGGGAAENHAARTAAEPLRHGHTAAHEHQAQQQRLVHANKRFVLYAVCTKISFVI